MKYIIYLLLFGVCFPANADECSHEEKTCFGVDWATATKRAVENMDAAAKQEDGATPLHWAAAYSPVEAVAELLAQGADVDAPAGWQGATPLHWAIMNGNEAETMALLLRHGADVNLRTQTRATPLHWAVRYSRNANVISLLLSKGVDVNAGNQEGQTALDIAMAGGDAAVVSVLQRHGAKRGADLSGECSEATGVCFGVNWKNARASQLGGVDVNARTKEGYTALHWAAQHSESSEVIAALVERGSDVNAKGWHDVAPLHLALTRNGSPEIAEALLRSGADANARSNSCTAADAECQNTPLQMAVREGKVEVVSALLGSGAEVDGEDEYGATPLQMAVTLNRSSEMIEALLASGARLSYKESKSGEIHSSMEEYSDNQKDAFSILHLAAGYHADPHVISLVLSAGVDVNVLDRGRKTPLQWAMEKKQRPEVIAALLANGADASMRENEKSLRLALRNDESLEVILTLLKNISDINAPLTSAKETALHLAARYSKNAAVLESLLKKGANVNALTRGNETPLHIAARYSENPEKVSLLLENGADVDLKVKRYRMTPLHYAARYNKNAEVISLLLRYGASANEYDIFNRTPLLLAVEYGENPAVVSLLLENGADVDLLTAHRKTPFLISDEIGDNQAIVAQLQKKDANITLLTKDGESALHLAVMNNKPAEHIAYLLEKGADANAIDNNGSTPLHLVRYRRDPAVVSVLLKGGADANKRDNRGDTPLHKAKNVINPAIIRLLLDYGAQAGVENKQGEIPSFVSKWRYKINKHSRQSEVPVLMRQQLWSGGKWPEDIDARYPDQWEFDLPATFFLGRDANWTVESAYHVDGNMDDVLLVLATMSHQRAKFGHATHADSKRIIYSLFGGEWSEYNTLSDAEEVLYDYQKLPLVWGKEIDVPLADGKSILAYDKCKVDFCTRQSVWNYDRLCRGMMYYSHNVWDSPYSADVSINTIDGIVIGAAGTGEYFQSARKFLVHANDKPIDAGKMRCIENGDEPWFWRGQITNWLSTPSFEGYWGYMETGYTFRFNQRWLLLPDKTLLAFDIRQHRGALVRLQADGTIPPPLREEYKWLSFDGLEYIWSNAHGIAHASEMLANYIKDKECTEKVYYKCMARLKGDNTISRHLSTLNKGIESDTELHTVVRKRPWEEQERIKELLQSGIDVNARNSDASTPLHVFAYWRNPDDVALLLEHGADVNARDNNGATPLHMAAARALNPEIIHLLLQHGADANAKDNAGKLPSQYSPHEIWRYIINKDAQRSEVHEFLKTLSMQLSDNAQMAATMQPAVTVWSEIEWPSSGSADYPDQWEFDLPSSFFSERDANWMVESAYHVSGDTDDVLLVLATMSALRAFPGVKTSASGRRIVYSVFSGEWRAFSASEEAYASLAGHEKLALAWGLEKDLPLSAGKAMLAHERCDEKNCTNYGWYYNELCGHEDLSLYRNIKRSKARNVSINKIDGVVLSTVHITAYKEKDRMFLVHANSEPMYSGNKRCLKSVRTLRFEEGIITGLLNRLDPSFDGYDGYTETGFTFRFNHRWLPLPDKTLLAFDIRQHRGVVLRLQSDGSIPPPLRDEYRWLSYDGLEYIWENARGIEHASKMLAKYITDEKCTEKVYDSCLRRIGVK